VSVGSTRHHGDDLAIIDRRRFQGHPHRLELVSGAVMAGIYGWCSTWPHSFFRLSHPRAFPLLVRMIGYGSPARSLVGCIRCRSRSSVRPYALFRDQTTRSQAWVLVGVLHFYGRHDGLGHLRLAGPGGRDHGAAAALGVHPGRPVRVACGLEQGGAGHCHAGSGRDLCLRGSESWTVDGYHHGSRDLVLTLLEDRLCSGGPG